MDIISHRTTERDALIYGRTVGDRYLIKPLIMIASNFDKCAKITKIYFHLRLKCYKNSLLVKLNLKNFTEDEYINNTNKNKKTNYRLSVSSIKI